MADEQELTDILTQLFNEGFTLGEIGTGDEQESVNEAQIALKALGYEQVGTKCPECKGSGKSFIPVEVSNDFFGTCPTCKGTGRKTRYVKLEEIAENLKMANIIAVVEDGKLLIKGYITGDNKVEWDREKVARRIAIERGLILWDNLPVKQTKECGCACQEACYRSADQLKEILTGEKKPKVLVKGEWHEVSDEFMGTVRSIDEELKRRDSPREKIARWLCSDARGIWEGFEEHWLKKAEALIEPLIKDAKKQERDRIIKGIHDIEFESNSATDFLNKTLYYLKAIRYIGQALKESE